jgi:hypothetical protein
MTWSTAGAEKCYDSPAHCEGYATLLDDTLEQMEIALRVLPLAEEITGCSKFGLAIYEQMVGILEEDLGSVLGKRVYGTSAVGA